jgi:hypothetical protein
LPWTALTWSYVPKSGVLGRVWGAEQDEIAKRRIVAALGGY